MDRYRVTVQEAARHLGVSEQAIRKRVKRGTIEHDKEEDGRVYVYLDSVLDGVTNPNNDTLISEMHSRIESLERQLDRAEDRDRENRRIIAALTQRIPELEPSPEP